MPERALRLQASGGLAYQFQEFLFKKQNARKGIKTHRCTGELHNFLQCKFKKQNARKGIKTQSTKALSRPVDRLFKKQNARKGIKTTCMISTAQAAWLFGLKNKMPERALRHLALRQV